MAGKPSEQSIFLHAVALASPADRAAYLEDVCRDNPQLRLELDALLAAHGRLGVDPAPCGPELPRTINEPTIERPGTVIGPYKLLQQIGEGGMGTVFMAEQTHPVQRKVALKIIKSGMDSGQVIARFEAERQALAMMDHQNIARVLDAGTTDGGRPYFVMELVHGVPITKFCDDRKLAPRQRLELIVPVCQAIQHAHQKGIIHRDIKPANVLVTMYDDRPVPKIIDFGVAKAVEQRLTEKTMFTQFGTLVGTFEYMSPEQAEMNAFGVDTRSDIYSLGVLLYELLTGTTPLEKKRLREAALDEMVRLIKEEEAPRPSIRLSSSNDLPKIAAARNTEPARLSGLVRGEVDWIVMKCLEKDRTRRYESASGLARDIQRHLADEPVEACPPSAGYRLRKFARKNRKALVIAGAFLVLLGAAAVVSTWQAFRAMAAAAAEKEAKETAQARQRETEAVLAFVENKILTTANPEGEEGGLGRNVSLRKAVEAALPSITNSFADQPLIEARLRMTLGTSLFNLGEDRIALGQFEAARTLYTKHLGPDHPDTLRSVSSLARVYTDIGRCREAMQLLEETIALQQSRIGPDHPDTLRSMERLTYCYSTVGRQADATRLSEEILTLPKAKFGPYDHGTIASMHGLAYQYNLNGRHADAAKLAEETLGLIQTKLGPDSWLTSLCMHNLALSYYFLDRHAEALKLHEESLALANARLGPDHPVTLMTMRSLSRSYYSLDRYADALKLCEEAAALSKTKFGTAYPDSLWSMNTLAWFLANMPDSKRRDPPRALELAKQVAEASPNEADCWGTYGIAQYRIGNWKGAAESLARAVVGLKPDEKTGLQPDAQDPYGTAHGFFLAMAHFQLGDKAEARQWFDKSVQWMEKELREQKELWPRDAELKRVRAEAEKVLELKK
jgi:serine/threonine protein kinase/tetratricopeptide (TPR) repeat protein